MSETAFMAHNSWQVKTDRLLPKKQLQRNHRKNHQRWMLVGATPKGMLLCNHSVRICGDAIGLKYPLVSTVNGREMPKSSLAISKLISSVGIRKPPNLIPRMAVQSRKRIAYSPQLKWKVAISVLNCCTKASPILCLMVYEGIRTKFSKPCSFRNSAYCW